MKRRAESTLCTGGNTQVESTGTNIRYPKQKGAVKEQWMIAILAP